MIIHTQTPKDMSTCVAQSDERRTSDLDVTGSRPQVVARHYTLCVVGK